MTLTATQAEPPAARQVASDLFMPASPDLSGLIDILTSRVGQEAAYRLASVASDVPERSVRRIPALAAETGAGWTGHWPRPVRMLPRPEAIETMALLPCHPPGWIAWRGVRHHLRRADEPERIVASGGSEWPNRSLCRIISGSRMWFNGRRTFRRCGRRIFPALVVSGARGDQPYS